MLKNAMLELSKMGIPVDFDSNAETVPIMGFSNGIVGNTVVSERKVYPNDLCPCGSGKNIKSVVVKDSVRDMNIYI